MTLKKIFFYFCLVLCLLTNLESRSQKWELGPIVGAGMASTRTTSFTIHLFPGYSGGLNLQRHLNSVFSIAANFLFDKKILLYPIYLTDPTGVVTGTYNIRLRYSSASLPIYGSWTFGGKKAAFLFNIGAYFNYLFTESYESKAIFYHQQTRNIYYVDNEKRFSAGFLIGPGFTAKLSARTTFSFEFRNCFGFTEGLSLQQEMYFNSHSILLGLTFKLGKLVA